MIYTILVSIILGLCLFFYALFGGADFGAGIIETFTGSKGNHTISKAIAPVWEANHIWLIIAIVILFNGFPKSYALFSTALHIPIMAILLGIIMRGTAFTFRHYDAIEDGSQYWYSVIFRFSSFFTLFFLGICFGTIISGTIPPTLTGNFYDYYMAPWLNLFSIAFGCFLIAIAAYISAVFLLGEVKTEDGYLLISKFVKRLFVFALIAGVGLFISAWWQNLPFYEKFKAHPFSLLSVLLATLLIPFIFRWMGQRAIGNLRIAVGLQIALIVFGWFIVQWPDIIVFSDGSTLDIYTAAAPLASMKVLFWSLFIGVLIIFPALYFLFKIFKQAKSNA